jgi:hypothetical protein
VLHTIAKSATWFFAICFVKKIISVFVTYIYSKSTARFYSKICNFATFAPFFTPFLSNLKEITSFLPSFAHFLSNLKEFTKQAQFYASYSPVVTANNYTNCITITDQ